MNICDFHPWLLNKICSHLPIMEVVGFQLLSKELRIFSEFVLEDNSNNDEIWQELLSIYNDKNVNEMLFWKNVFKYDCSNIIIWLIRERDFDLVDYFYHSPKFDHPKILTKLYELQWFTNNNCDDYFNRLINNLNEYSRSIDVILANSHSIFKQPSPISKMRLRCIIPKLKLEVFKQYMEIAELNFPNALKNITFENLQYCLNNSILDFKELEFSYWDVEDLCDTIESLVRNPDDETVFFIIKRMNLAILKIQDNISESYAVLKRCIYYGKFELFHYLQKALNVDLANAISEYAYSPLSLSSSKDKIKFKEFITRLVKNNAIHNDSIIRIASKLSESDSLDEISHEYWERE